MQNAPRTKRITQRLTRGLEKNGLGAKISTQRLTLGLYENPELGNPYTSKRRTRGLSENAPRANLDTSKRLPPLSPSSKQGQERELSIGNL